MSLQKLSCFLIVAFKTPTIHKVV